MRSSIRLTSILALIAIAAPATAQTPRLSAGSAQSRWEPEISAFEAADKTNPPPSNAILFVGSSSIRLWPDLQSYFPGQHVFKRGFGGSEMADSVEFAGRIVLPYHPSLILVYAGDNDLANGKTPERVLADFKEFVARVRSAQPGTPIAFIAIKPCPARKNLLNQVREANRLVEAYTATDPKLAYADIFTPMFPEGKLRPELFREDGLHMNEKGYEVWAAVIRPIIWQFGK